MALTVKIRADASHFKKTIAGIEVQASGLTGVMGKLGSSIPVMGAALTAAAVAASALGASLAFIKSASGAAAGMETLQVQFEVLTKSADKAKGLIKSFREEAIKSPLSVEDYAQAGKTLMAFGISADETLPILKTLGDVSMGNAERFGSLALAFAQTQAAGRLMGQEVLQFVNAGFNPLQEISRKTGRSMIELKKAMEDGAISSAMVTDAFKSATSAGGLFYGALEKGASTTEGKIAKFNDTILGLKVSFGTGFNEGLKSALDSMNVSLPQFEARFTQFGQTIGRGITNAVKGDYDIFVKIGVVIGEAIKAGIKSALDYAHQSMMATPEMEKGGTAEFLHDFLTQIGAAKKIAKPDMASIISQNLGGFKEAMSSLGAASDVNFAERGTNEQVAEQRKHTDLLRRIADWTREQKMQTPKPLTSR
jgi:tape measure domain-containing protein